MKKIFLIMTMATITFFSYGQKNEVNSAYNAYQNGYLDRAKTAIDKAVLNEYTKTEARTWLYCGNIYLLLADANTNEKSKNREYKGLCDNCVEVAYEAFRKASELDNSITVSNMAFSNPKSGLDYCAHFLYEDAFRLYQQKKYNEAFDMAEKAYKANSASDYITYFYAFAAENANKGDIAKARYNDMVRKKTKEMNAYIRLANIYKNEKDTAKMLKVMKDGEPLFFWDDTINADYAVSYSILLSWANESEKAEEIMNKALKKYPNNYILLINYGSALSNDEEYEKAEIYFKRAVELQPNEAITVYNLGSCYYNRYVKRMKEVELIVNNDEYRVEQEKAKKLLEEAHPYLEKAHQLDPKDKFTLSMLKGIYANLGLNDELKAVEEKLNAL